MNTAEETKQKYETGFPVFKRLFEMDSASLKEKLFQICATHHDKEVFKNGKVTKTLVDDVPDSISISWYASFDVTAFGIYYIPEHGGSGLIVEFNEFFKLS